MPCRRRFVVATVSDTARNSPRIGLLLRSTPSQRNVCSLTFTSLRATAAAVAMTFPSYACGLLVGDGLDLLERGDAGLDLQEPGLAQVLDAFTLRELRDVDRVAVAHD